MHHLTPKDLNDQCRILEFDPVKPATVTIKIKEKEYRYDDPETAHIFERLTNGLNYALLEKREQALNASIPVTAWHDFEDL